MRTIPIAALLALVAFTSLHARAQPKHPPSSPESPTAGSRVSVAIGSVVVPPGSVSYRTGGSVDWFFGHIQVARPSLRVIYAVGMVARRPSGLRAKGYRWIKQETLPSGALLTYGERLQDGDRLIEANVAMANFFIVRTSESDEAAFLAIVRTYGPCQSCPQPVHIVPAT